MGLFSKLKEPKNAPATTGDYIDLEDYVAESGVGSSVLDSSTTYVRVAEIHKYDDLRELADYVYRGNMLLLDFQSIASDEIILKRVTGELKKLVADIGGDIAGLGKSMLIITPTAMKIDRTKHRAK